ncbi:hypothetical protein VKT23_014456 [Stygiomarasmius scandens]|uniref:MPN domain-containing protein n=1 Tax=Marasmiellus scandens TaxID=2682957 RepID=A0ABR1J0X9_9AGAR
MPTLSTSVTSALSIPVSSSYSSGASRKDFPQAASVPSSTVYHPPSLSRIFILANLPNPAHHISQMRPMTGLVDLRISLPDTKTTTRQILTVLATHLVNGANLQNHARKGHRRGLPLEGLTVFHIFFHVLTSYSSPSTYPPPITTTSPPPADRIEYPQLMTQHQQTQGYRPSLNSMFSGDSKSSVPEPGNSLMLDHRSSNLYSTDLLPPPSSIPPAGMPYPFHHQRQQSQSTHRDPSPNPSSSYANRPPPPVPAQPPPPPRREERTSRNSSPPAPELKTVLLPRESLARFLTIAKVNTSRNRETCGLLLGRAEGRKYVVTTLLIPKQHSTSDTCAMDEEELVLQFTEERGLITLGWIHTHPTQSCFMSSVDLHTHSGFQCMLPESFAVVCAPQSNPNVGIFRLTDPPGLQTILRCNAKEAFHPHPDLPIYTDADKGHVQMRDLSLEIVDIR